MLEETGAAKKPFVNIIIKLNLQNFARRCTSYPVSIVFGCRWPKVLFLFCQQWMNTAEGREDALSAVVGRFALA